MRLISLTANQQSFHTVTFRPSGPTLIVAAQQDVSVKRAELTYNGVGKSLVIALVHFCLGSKKNQEFESKLPGWQFVLHFEHQGKEYRASRTTDEQNKINLDGEEMSLTEYSDMLEKMLFALPEAVSFLTFRSLIPYFARPRRESYTSFDQTDNKSTPYARLLRVAFLLGLDITLVTSKHDLRVEQDRVKTLRANLSKDTIVVEFFTGNKNVEIELLDLDHKIAALRQNLDAFKIAEDYHERQREADVSAHRVQALRNKLVVIRNAIDNITDSLNVVPDIAPDMIYRIFEETSHALPAQVVKRIEDVAAFHTKLLENRIRRLTQEKMVLEREYEAVEREIAMANGEVDELRRFLGTHGALDEFVAISEMLNEHESRAQKLRDYKELLEQYSNRIQELTVKLSTETIRTTKYLKDAKVVLDGNMDRFRSLSSRFYGDKPGGLSVTNNEGENQTRFDIEARIEDDAADGINEVKIFCFDMTVLAQRHNHSMDFLFHDSRLFSDVDIRQRATIFKVAREVAAKEGYQYIATLNEDQIDAMRSQFTDKEFKECIEDGIVLRLTDESPESKLLGIQVDMHY